MARTEAHLGALFPDRETAEVAVAGLQRMDVVSGQLGVAVHEPDARVREEDTVTEVAHGIEKGIAVGAPVGSIAGMALLALVVPGVGTLGVGGVLAAGGITGALAGTYVGAFLGLASEEHVLEEESDWRRVPLRPGEVLVVVAGHDDPDRVSGLLEQLGGELVAKPSHIT